MNDVKHVKTLQKKYREMAKEKGWDISFSYQSGMKLQSEKGYIKAFCTVDRDFIMYFEIDHFTKSKYSTRHESSKVTPNELKPLASFYFEFCKEYAAIKDAMFVIFKNTFYSEDSKLFWRRRGFLEPEDLFEGETNEKIRDTFPVVIENDRNGRFHPRFIYPVKKDLLCSLYKQRTYVRESLCELQQNDPLFFWEENVGTIQISLCKKSFYFDWSIVQFQNYIYQLRAKDGFHIPIDCDKETIFTFFENWKEETKKKHRLASIFESGSFYIQQYLRSLNLEKEEKGVLKSFLLENFNLQDLELHCAHTINTFKKNLEKQKKTMQHMDKIYTVIPLWDKFVITHAKKYEDKTYTLCDSEESMKTYIKTLMTKEIDGLLLASL